jgi:hypothetical protein
MPQKARDWAEHCRIRREYTTQKRSPWEVNRHLVRKILEFCGQPLNAFDEECGVLQTRSLGAPGAS